MVNVVVVDVMLVVDVVVMVVDVGPFWNNSKCMEYFQGGYLGFENPIQTLLFCS